MNYKRALEIKRDIEALSGQRKEYPMAYWESCSFIEAVDKMKPLVEALERMSAKAALQKIEREMIDGALTIYRREVLGK